MSDDLNAYEEIQDARNLLKIAQQKIMSVSKAKGECSELKEAWVLTDQANAMLALCEDDYEE